MMKPSKLVEGAWSNMGYHRCSIGNTEILAAVYGPYESRNSQKSEYTKSLVEVVISDTSFSIDHSQNEKAMGDLFSSVIDNEKYPYLSIVICIQIFAKDENLMSACINAAYLAAVSSGLEIKYKIIAKDFLVEDSRLTLAVVPSSIFIVFSLCSSPVSLEAYKRCVEVLAQEPELAY